MKMYRIVVGGSFGAAVFLTVLTGVLAANDREAAPMSEEAKAATARLKTISESRNAPDLAELGRLLEAGANINVINRFGCTPLMMASGNGHIKVVKLLLAHKADVNAKRTTTGCTPLFQASQNGHTEVVKLLLAHKADVNIAHKRIGFTPLWMASQNGHTEIVKLLLAHKADVNVVDKRTGATPLFMASQQGHAAVVELLLAAGANVHAKASMAGKDYTPLSVAKHMGHTRIVKLLKKHGAKE